MRWRVTTCSLRVPVSRQNRNGQGQGQEQLQEDEAVTLRANEVCKGVFVLFGKY